MSPDRAAITQIYRAAEIRPVGRPLSRFRFAPAGVPDDAQAHAPVPRLKTVY